MKLAEESSINNKPPLFNHGTFSISTRTEANDHQQQQQTPSNLLPSPAIAKFIYNDCDLFELELIDILDDGDYESLSVTAYCGFYKKLLQFKGTSDAMNINPLLSVSTDIDATNEWSRISCEQKLKFIRYLVEIIDGKEEKELGFEDGLNAALHLVFGTIVEERDEDVLVNSRTNILLFFKAGGLRVLLRQFVIRTNDLYNSCKKASTASTIYQSKLRKMIVLLYFCLETVRVCGKMNEEWSEARQGATDELSRISLAALTMNLVSFLPADSDMFLRSQLIMLSWKSVLLTLGGMEEAMEARRSARIKYGIEGPPNSVHDENAIEIRKALPNCIELIESSPCIDYGDQCISMDTKRLKRPYRTDVFNAWCLFSEMRQSKLGMESFLSDLNKKEDIFSAKSFPWRAKCTKDCLLAYLNENRQKHFGFTLANDYKSVRGLPPNIIESFNVFRSFLYEPLSDHQIELDERQEKYPLTSSKTEQNNCEKLYSALLMLLPTHTMKLVDLLDHYLFVNEQCSVVKQYSKTEFVERNRASMALASVKAITGLLILLLKHLKTNHIYQFEYLCNCLVEAQFLKRLSKFLDSGGIHHLHSTANRIRPQDILMSCRFIKNELDDEQRLIYCDRSWCSLYITVNLLWIANKICKGSRIRAHHLFDPNIISNLRKVFQKSSCNSKDNKTPLYSLRNCPLVQYYDVKLVKVMSQFWGRQWRKMNLYRYPVLYHMIRHRINDDCFAQSVPSTIDSADTAIHRCLLKKIRSFHERKYLKETVTFCLNNDWVDRRKMWCSDFLHELKHSGDEVATNLDFNINELPKWFLENTAAWVDKEVMNERIDWDALLEEKGNRLVLY